VKAAIAATAIIDCADHVRWYESNMEYRLRVYLGFPESGALGTATSSVPEGAAWWGGQLEERVKQADRGMYAAEEFVLRGRLVEVEPDQRLLVQGAVSLLEGRKQRLERAHHALQLCFATDPAETRAAIAEHAAPLGLPRSEVCFGWPANGEYLDALRLSRRETGL
jgi:hypothetical protein